ncbi:MAG: dockerin type I repeat-containing protein [Chloroflexi bacterium]|nr:dockerin type I repeat-containing protein [Chloroflexota bacterium]
MWKYVNPVVAAGPLTQGDPLPEDEISDGNAVFRASRYGPDHPGLLGRELTSQGAIELPKPIPSITTTPTVTIQTPTATAAAPLRLSGDANCDEMVTSVDAALVLQHSSGFEGSIRCELNADVNGDRAIDSLDALIILQFVAGLLPSLPA